MRNKTKRLLTIRKLIESELISSQEELLFRLKEMNVEATQSTLSRDLKFMKVAKIPHKEKGYIYVIPESIQNEQREEKVSAIITDTILSIDFSGDFVLAQPHEYWHQYWSRIAIFAYSSQTPFVHLLKTYINSQSEQRTPNFYLLLHYPSCPLALIVNCQLSIVNYFIVRSKRSDHACG
mgnify:CR=1 FL=1